MEDWQWCRKTGMYCFNKLHIFKQARQARWTRYEALKRAGAHSSRCFLASRHYWRERAKATFKRYWSTRRASKRTRQAKEMI